MAAINIKILTIGSATQDVFLQGKALHARRDVRSRDFVEQFLLGAKLEVDHVTFSTGGGATNAAVTFARQGFEAGFVGKVGHDPAGTEVLRELGRETVATDRVMTDTRATTSYSVLLLAPDGERTILNYRGASHELKAGDMAIGELKADWLYITSLAGDLGLLGKLLRHAKQAGIHVALDPGEDELRQGRKLRQLVPLLTILKANAQELRQLYGGTDLRETVTAAAGKCDYIVGTDGAAGAYAAHEGRLYQAGVYQKVRVADRTGAGDAFGSGFVAAIAQGHPIQMALTLGSANATGVVQKIGAKAGILRTNRLKLMKIKESAL